MSWFEMCSYYKYKQSKIRQGETNSQTKKLRHSRPPGLDVSVEMGKDLLGKS